MNNKPVFAICATAFFLMFAYVIAAYGPSVIAWALLFGAVSQFVAQDEHPAARWLSLGNAYVAMGFCFAAALGY